jgi:CBS domain-containing protein
LNKEPLMRIQEVMTSTPACCTPDTGLREVAQMMVEYDCGQIPLVRSTTDPKVLGVVTDRDIVSRLVALGRNPLDLRADACMSQPVITVSTDDSLEDCIRLMELHRIRRVPVVDGDGLMRGIVSQADIAQHVPHASTGELVKEVSRVRRPKPETVGKVAAARRTGRQAGNAIAPKGEKHAGTQRSVARQPKTARTRLDRGPVDAPGKRHRKPVPPQPMNALMGEPRGKQMGQKSLKTGRRGG